jgi:hypothetical protein
MHASKLRQWHCCRPPTVRNNPCLCGEVPAQLAMWAGSPEAAGTNLTTPCAPDCIPNAPVPGNITSPDTPRKPQHPPGVQTNSVLASHVCCAAGFRVWAADKFTVYQCQDIWT